MNRPAFGRVERAQSRFDALAMLAGVLCSSESPRGCCPCTRGRKPSGRWAATRRFRPFNCLIRERSKERGEATVSAICEAIRARRFAYSDPPPGWDYSTAGQRIRDHGEVARGGLATCMDSTVLTAAVMEHVGMFPVLTLVQGHIFIGYWRRIPPTGPTGTRITR